MRPYALFTSRDKGSPLRTHWGNDPAQSPNAERVSDRAFQLGGFNHLPTDQPIFQIGDRVRLSELGASRMKRVLYKTGSVVGAGKASKLAVRVLFDGMRTPVSLHQSYLSSTSGKREPAAQGPRTRRDKVGPPLADT